MGTISKPARDMEEIVLVTGFVDVPVFKVPLRVLQMSPVWRDALHMDGLSRGLPNTEVTSDLSSANERNTTGMCFQLDESPATLYILFKVLDGTLGIADENPPEIAHWVGGNSALYIRTTIRLADKYDLPHFEAQLISCLWRLATIGAEDALLVFAVAWERQDFGLAQHAMRYFRNLPPPSTFDLDMAKQIGLGAFWHLSGITQGQKKIDWIASASELSRPIFWTKNVPALVNPFLRIKVKTFEFQPAKEKPQIVDHI